VRCNWLRAKRFLFSRHGLVLIPRCVLPALFCRNLEKLGSSPGFLEFICEGQRDPDRRTGFRRLCTFCHTPHGAISTQLAWNHTLFKNVFDWGVVATTAGTPYPKFKGDTYKGPSARCLSCHDGSVAIGDVASFRQSVGVLSADRIGTNGFAVTRQVGADDNMAGSHPLAMPYPLYRAANTYNGIISGAQLAANEWVPDGY
jgi:hypothetical protein